MRPRLNRVLQHAVSYALLGSACGASVEATESNVKRAAVAGTSSDEAAPPEEDGAPAESPVAPVEFEVLPCLPPGESQFEHMLLPRAYDYAVQRTKLFPLLENQSEAHASGEPCASATDSAACLERLAATWPTESGRWQTCVQLCESNAVVLTTGDAVELLDNPDAVRQWLGTIDTPHEAALLASASNFTARCDETRFAIAEDGFTLLTRELVASCPVILETFTLQVSAAGEIEVTARTPDEGPPSGLCIGRRPAGLEPSPPAATLPTRRTDAGGVGPFFAEVARLEASAVQAFRIMARELAALGAPRLLERAARRAARDEIRHARLAARQARRHGAAPRSPQTTPRPPRPLFELALENVVEGCVRETYGAACGRFQALAASDPGLRAQLERVAREEAQHAELSWRIHGWAQGRLSRAERAALQQAAQRAITELRSELERDPGRAVCEVAGMPAREQALALLDSLQSQLWSNTVCAAA